MIIFNYCRPTWICVFLINCLSVSNMAAQEVYIETIQQKPPFIKVTVDTSGVRQDKSLSQVQINMQFADEGGQPNFVKSFSFTNASVAVLRPPTRYVRYFEMPPGAKSVVSADLLCNVDVDGGKQDGSRTKSSGRKLSSHIKSPPAGGNVQILGDVPAPVQR